MPICPNCGGKRVEQFCARCGSTAVGSARVYPSTPAPRPLSGQPGSTARVGLAVALVLMVAGAVFFFFMQTASRSVPGSGLRTVPAMPNVATADRSSSADSDYARRLSEQLARAIEFRETRINGLTNRRAVLAADQTKWNRAGLDTERTLEILQRSYLSAEETGHWPIRVGDRWFKQLDAESALTKMRRYLETVDWAQRDIDTAIELADKGLIVARSRLTELQVQSKFLPANPSSGYIGSLSSLQRTGDRITEISSRAGEIPDPGQLGSSRSAFEPLDLGNLGR